MKKVAIFLLFVFFIFSVSLQEAIKISENWVKFINAEYGNLGIFRVSRMPLMRLNYPQRWRWRLIKTEPIKWKGEKVAFISKLFPSGYILVANTKVLNPIKMYSPWGEFNPKKVGFQRDVLRFLYRVIIYKKKAQLKPSFQIALKWEFLSQADEKMIIAASQTQEVFGPIVETRWAQSYPYNKFTPKIGNTRTPVGCVAVAFAQVMRFWHWPWRGRGSHSYYWYTGKKTLSANFDHDYLWDKMPTTLRGASDEEINQVARLLSDVGIALEMEYDVGGSGTYIWNGVDAMPKFFRYSNSIDELWRCTRWAYSSTKGWYCLPGGLKDANTWYKELRREIEQFEPFVFAIYSVDVGHAVVVDGYKSTDAGNFVHINMGWGGSSDAFYGVDHILDFTDLQWQHAVINQVPEELPPKPRAVQIFRKVNRGVFVKEYWDEIHWQPPASGTVGIKGYVVLRYDPDTGFVDYLGSVNKGAELVYRVKVGGTSRNYKYAVLCVSEKGAYGKPSSFVQPQK